MQKRISIFGLGYVGTVLFGCLARDGHYVTGVDVDPVKVNLLRNGQSPIVEEGIQSLISETMKIDHVEVTDDTASAITNSEISFICVGTPSNPNGSQDLSAIKKISQRLGESLKSKAAYHVIVIRSTIIPGSMNEVVKPILEKHSGKKCGDGFGLCFMPEFLREGSSVKDYYNPPFTIIGGDSEQSINIIKEVFSNLPGEFITTSIQTAEMVKYCCNIFHALKITFANEIGRICQVLKVDSREIMELVCKDTILNISPAYLKPGFAFGGSCLPKDLRGLLYATKMHDAEVPMLQNILPSNALHIENAVDIVLRWQKRNVALVGLSFKGGTDDLRESPHVVMAEKLIGKGMNLKIYDPTVNFSRLIGANRRYIEQTIPHIASLMCNDRKEVINSADTIIIAHKDAVFMDTFYSLCRTNQFILDLVGCVEKTKIPSTYKGICW